MPIAPPPTPSADKRPTTSEQILDVALGLFSDIGYAAASMRAIAAAVGVEPSSLYHHFRSKEDILWSLTVDAWSSLESDMARAMAAIPADAAPADRLRAFVGAHVRFHATRARSARLVNSNLDALSAARRAAVVERRDRYEQTLRAILADGIASGAFDVSRAALTSMAVLQLCSSVAGWFDPQGSLAVDEVVEAYDELVLRMTGAASDQGAGSPPDPESA